MAHFAGVTVEIVGIKCSDRGRSCEEHEVCGSVFKEDVVVRFRKVQIEVVRVEETAIEAVWVSDGIDWCRVGFLPRHCVKHYKTYEGKLGQVVDMYRDSDSPTKRRKHHRGRGCCLVAIISATYSAPDLEDMPSTKQQKTGDRHEISG